jgi:MoxR-like ATPase
VAVHADTDLRSDNWWIYRGTGEPHDGIDQLPPPPRWRTFTGGPLVSPVLAADDLERDRRLGAPGVGSAYRPDDHVVDLTNTALYLRRPLLVTGRPGTGKSTLAYSIATELKLGPVLHWPVTSRATLAEALYRYDAIGRLQEAGLYGPGADRPASPPDIGRYVRLGPLGTALLPQTRPRVVLIDEFDKSDVDLPNDLLNVLETGEFVIPELARLPDDQAEVDVMITAGRDRIPVRNGLVRCRAFPVVIITSNGERDFPPAFLRRCVQLEIQPPSRAQLANIVAAQLGEDVLANSAPLIERFIAQRAAGALATDQLLNAIYLATGRVLPDASRKRVTDAVLTNLDPAEH